jgi:pyroglutamyl-peptidase
MIVVGAFEPFGGRRRNRAWEAASLLAGRTLAGHAVEVTQLPVVFAQIATRVDALLARSPSLLLLVGESGGARRLQLEELGVNVAHAPGADNAGARPIDQELEPGAPLARRIRFAPDPVLRAAVAAGAPCERSHHAGTFLCNAALYHALGRAPDGCPVAFVHVPARWPWARNRRAARGLSAIAAAILQG